MTSEEIKKGNEIIARFLNLKENEEGNFYVPFYLGITEWFSERREVIEKDTEYVLMRPDQLEFHTSWDWLMPVVEKIESMWLIVQIQTRYCSILWLGTEDDKYPWLQVFEDIHVEPDSLEQSKIETVWQTVVEFIQWYNTHNSPQ